MTHSASDAGTRGVGIGHRVAGGLLMAVLVLYPAVGLLTKNALGTLFLLSAVLILGLAWAADRRRLIPGWEASVLAVLLGSAASVGLVLGVCERCGEQTIEKLPLALLLLWIGSAPLLSTSLPAARRVLTATLGGIGLGLVVGMIELSADAWIYRMVNGFDSTQDVWRSRYNRGVTALLLLSWVVVPGLMATRRRAWAIGLVVAATGLALWSDSAATQLAAGVALVVWLIALAAPRGALLLVLTGSAAIIVSAPWTLGELLGVVSGMGWSFAPSHFERLEIWNHASGHALSGPWWGHGIGSHRTLPLIDAATTTYAILQKPPIHAHNAAVQLWIEFGWMGAFLGVGLLWVIWRELMGKTDTMPIPPSFVAAAAAGLTISMLAYGTWQISWLGTIGTVLVVAKASAALAASALHEGSGGQS